jgi:hypothetical protein
MAEQKLCKEATKINVFIHNVEDLEKHQSKYYSKWIPKAGIFFFCDSVVLKEQIEPEAYRRLSSFKENQEAATLPSTSHAERGAILPTTISCRRSCNIAINISRRKRCNLAGNHLMQKELRHLCC